MQTTVLIVEDNLDYAEGVRENLSLYGIEGLTESNQAQAAKTALAYRPDVVFIDICLGNENGVDLLEELKPKLCGTSFVMITGYGTIDSAIRSLKLGAKDYLQKPVSFESILQTISSVAQPNQQDRDSQDGLLETARSAEMRALMQRVEKLASTALPILIYGESGAGKELVADYIVRRSQNEDDPYVKINSCAFSESLLDNELFGHEKGAYTGATSTFRGVFERANGGTLFLDEIGDMPWSIQSKILRALQDKQIRRLGSEDVVNVDVRFIAATNKNLEAMIKAGEFREDLYYRLNTAQVSLPPLRKRPEDIEAICASILRSSYGHGVGGASPALSPAVLDLFRRYHWPGNIRELRNTLLYASAMASDTSEITMDHLPANMTPQDQPREALTSLQESERQLIVRTLEATEYNKSETASRLDISRSTLYEKIKKYGITVHE